MCTAITFHGDHFYFGRTLDHICSYAEEVVLSPRNHHLTFRQCPRLSRHLAILGMAHVEGDYPLYYDAMNEAGLCMAGLNFTGFARYGNPGRDRIAPFEFLPWILGQCESLSQARVLLTHTALTETDFSAALPCARLHWLIADPSGCITVEAAAGGLQIHDNPLGVLTNDPPFDDQLLQLTNFMQLSPCPPVNRFSPALGLKPYSLGMGAMGLPGDLSSQSRFVRAAFTKCHAAPGGIEQFFHILDAVCQTKGCNRLEDGSMEFTRYASCCDGAEGRYLYTTAQNRRITAVDMDREDLEGRTLVRYPLLTQTDIRFLN